MKTTKADYRAFKKRVRKVLAMWGLSHIDLWFEWIKTDECRAQCYFDPEGQIATIRLSRYSDGRTRREARRLVLESAVHESHHIVLAELYNLARRRHITETDLERAEHTAVRRMDRFVKKYGKIKK